MKMQYNTNRELDKAINHLGIAVKSLSVVVAVYVLVILWKIWEGIL